MCEGGEIGFGVAGCEMLIQRKKWNVTIFLKYCCVHEVWGFNVVTVLFVAVFSFNFKVNGSWFDTVQQMTSVI